MPRTDEQKLTMAPIKVKFGEKDYDIRPLKVLRQQEWRKKLNAELGPVVNDLQVTRVANTTLVTGLPTAMAPFADKVIDLLFAYAPELPRDAILEDATEEQIALAFSQVWELVFTDFLGLLGSAAQLLKPMTMPQASPRALN